MAWKKDEELELADPELAHFLDGEKTFSWGSYRL